MQTTVCRRLGLLASWSLQSSVCVCWASAAIEDPLPRSDARRFECGLVRKGRQLLQASTRLSGCDYSATA